MATQIRHRQHHSSEKASSEMRSSLQQGRARALARVSPPPPRAVPRTISNNTGGACSRGRRRPGEETTEHMQPRQAGGCSSRREGWGSSLSRSDLGGAGTCARGRHRGAAATDSAREGASVVAADEGGGAGGGARWWRGSDQMEGWGQVTGAGEGNETALPPPFLGAAGLRWPALQRRCSRERWWARELGG